MGNAEAGGGEPRGAPDGRQPLPVPTQAEGFEDPGRRTLRRLARTQRSQPSLSLVIPSLLDLGVCLEASDEALSKSRAVPPPLSARCTRITTTQVSKSRDRS